MSIFALRSNGLASSAYKNLSRTQSSLNDNISRLASGLRINNTADDSAGSNVSVRMDNQIRGMAQANRNAQGANNLLATAESGLSDISDILSRMRELAVQSSTDTLNDADRASIDLEFQSLKDEFTRIANVTEYNGMNVLNGTYQQANGDGVQDATVTWAGTGPESLFNATKSASEVNSTVIGTTTASGSVDLTIGGLKDAVKDGAISLYSVGYTTSSSFTHVTTDPSSGWQIEVDDSDDFVLNVNNMAIGYGHLNFDGDGTAIGDMDGTTPLYENQDDGSIQTSSSSTTATDLSLTISGLKTAIKNGAIDLYANSGWNSFSHVTTDSSSGWQIEVDNNDSFVINVDNKMKFDSGGHLNFGGDGTAIGDLNGTTSLYTDGDWITTDSDDTPLTVSGQTTTNVYAQMPNGSSSVWVGDQTPNVYDQAQPGTSGSSDPHGTAGPDSFNIDGPADNIRGHWRVQIGADNDVNNQHEFSITNATANGLDLDTDNVTTVDSARDAITAIDHAIDEINRERSYIGSEQNKLQFTMSNLTSNVQSIEAARSSIEDVDFAAEAANLAKNQILAQSGTAMLAQAAAISQNILGLLA